MDPYESLIESLIEEKTYINTAIMEDYSGVIDSIRETEKKNAVLGTADSTIVQKFDYEDNVDERFLLLAKAFDQWRNSCNVREIYGNRFRSITKAKRDFDFKYVNYNVQPYELGFSTCRFYFFPNSIWVFNDEKGLLGIYTQEAVKCEIVTTSKTASNTMRIFHDTTVISREDPANIQFIACLFELQVGDSILKFDVSSVENCNLLKRAISIYTKQIEVPDDIDDKEDRLEIEKTSKDTSTTESTKEDDPEMEVIKEDVVCPKCGSYQMYKRIDVFVCNRCGNSISIEEAKRNYYNGIIIEKRVNLY